MSQLTDQHHLQTDQYRDASNLNVRICVHQRFSTNDYPWRRWVFDRFNLPQSCEILEVGCGPGNLWLENSDRIPPEWTIVLSDLSPGMVQNARRNLSSSHQRIAYRVIDAQAIPFPDGSFDAVVANHMLYHVLDSGKSLYEIHRVLRAGGHLYASTNGLEHRRELRDLAARFHADANATDVAAEFGLENGAAQLSRHFAHVMCKRREDALVVTEAEPLIAYARSTMCQVALGQNVEAFMRSVREQIAAQGAVRIRKDSGIFLAAKA